MFVGVNKDEKDWTQFTVVIPAVSVGNVGQLAADLLIATLSPRLAGSYYCDSVLPVVGNDPFATHLQTESQQLATAVQVYESAEHRVVIVQQRAPCVRGKAGAYVDELLAWIQACRFKRVVMLTSMFAHERRDVQITGLQMRYLATSKASGDATHLKDAGFVPLESRPPMDFDPPASGGEREPIFIPGGGIAKQFYLKCAAADVAAVVMLVFCAEGDNISDALVLASFSNSMLQLVPATPPAGKDRCIWKIPSSWRLQFGSHIDRTLF